MFQGVIGLNALRFYKSLNNKIKKIPTLTKNIDMIHQKNRKVKIVRNNVT